MSDSRENETRVRKKRFLGMKQYLCLYFSIIVLHELVNCTAKPWKKKTLRSVTTFSGLEKLYRDSKLEKDPLKIQPDTDIAIKRSICYYVFSSSHFNMIEEVLVDPHQKDSRRKLYAYDRRLYNEFYTCTKIGRKRDLFIARAKRRRIYHYDNGYKDRSVSVDAEISNERVFTCIVQEKTGNIKEYFVSQEYNMNKTFSPEYFTGRFVFAYNTSGQLVVTALAEEAALFHTAYNSSEFLYFARRQRIRIYKNKENDPICKMSEEDKLRTCSAIMSMPELTSDFKFWPTMNSVEPECVERELAFRSEHIKSQLEMNGTAYTEWTFACKAERIKDKAEEKFFVSRSYHVNKVFVCRPTPEEKIKIEFIGSSIAVVHDLMEFG